MKVDSLDFSFPRGWNPQKYDEWKFYVSINEAFQFECECVSCKSHSCPGQSGCSNYSSCTKKRKKEGRKGVDILVKNERRVWLIESKDYRREPNPPLDHIINEVAKKFRDTLAGLWMASLYAENDELRLSNAVRREPNSFLFVFHFESPSVPYASGFFPQSSKMFSLKTVCERLSQKIGPLAKNLYVMDMDEINGYPESYEWNVTEAIP